LQDVDMLHCQLHHDHHVALSVATWWSSCTVSFKMMIMLHCQLQHDDQDALSVISWRSSCTVSCNMMTKLYCQLQCVSLCSFCNSCIMKIMLLHWFWWSHCLLVADWEMLVVSYVCMCIYHQQLIICAVD
jgi:hypothetical protein